MAEMNVRIARLDELVRMRPEVLIVLSGDKIRDFLGGFENKDTVGFLAE